MAFYKSIGFENNPHFSDDTTKSMVWSEVIHVMLLTLAKGRTFTSRALPDRHWEPDRLEIEKARRLPFAVLTSQREAGKTTRKHAPPSWAHRLLTLNTAS
jgi:hypothetical protein